MRKTITFNFNGKLKPGNWNWLKFFRFTLLFPCLVMGGYSSHAAILATSNIFAYDNNFVKQDFVVKGTVTDSIGTPLFGATILEKGTNNGTQSDFDGNFSLTVSGEDAILSISYVGFSKVDIPVKGRNTIKVVLKSDQNVLDEVVVVGYGSVSKKDLTTAVTNIKPDELTQGTASPILAIQGKVPGLSVVSTNGSDPNAGVNIQLRGINSINASQGPLIVIDGVPGGSISNVNREDIESISVLRDASAGAIYGTRASGGVILITTKNPKAGVTSVSLTHENYMETIRKRPDVLSAQEYVDLERGEDFGYRTDWFDEVTNNNAMTYRDVLTVSGGSENAKVYASFNFRDATGTAIQSKLKEYGGRINTEFTFLDGFAELRSNISYNQQDSRYSNNGIFNQALVLNPTRTPYDEEDITGYNVVTGGFDNYNPVAEVMLQNDERQFRNLLANATLKLNLADGLSTSLTVGINDRTDHGRFYRSSEHRISRNDNVDGYASQDYNRYSDRILEWTNTYKKTFGDHDINAVAGFSYQDFNGQGFNANNSNFPVDRLQENSLGSGTFLPEGRAGIGSFKNPTNKLAAFFGRLNYSFKDRYLLSASVRHEGSSKFAKDVRWGTFPGASVGWRVSAEPFMQDIKVLSDLKLRGSYGETGNDGFDASRANRLFNPDVFWLIDGEWTKTFGLAFNQNASLKWEVKKEFNVGFDFGLFNNRLTGSFDYYDRKVVDLIYNIDVSQPPAIYEQTLSNVGDMQNTGFEGEISGVIVDNGNFNYKSTIIFSHNKSILKSLNGGSTYQDRKGFPAPGSPGSAVRLSPGERIGQFFIWRSAGFTDDGQWLLYDQNNNVINASEKTIADKSFVGNAIPKLTLSWNHNLRYKNFDASIFLRSWLGFDVFNMQNMYYGIAKVAGQNVLHSAYGKNKNITREKQLSDYWLEKGDFVKLDAVTVGYTFPTDIVKPFSSLRLYATGRDLLTITGYSGLDPEVYINGLDPGFEGLSAYPKTSTYMLGVQIGF